jgi:replication factor A1
MGRMNFNETVERILSSRQDLSRDEVLGMIEEKKKKANGFFTNAVAARLLALELGVAIGTMPFQPKVQIGDLVSGLNDITVTGRVTSVYPPNTFSRPDLTEGKVANLLIADETDMLRVVLWDEKTSILEEGKVGQGQVIRVSHGYVREGRSGRLEVHVGSKGSIEVLLSSAKE